MALSAAKKRERHARACSWSFIFISSQDLVCGSLVLSKRLQGHTHLVPWNIHTEVTCQENEAPQNRRSAGSEAEHSASECTRCGYRDSSAHAAAMLASRHAIWSCTTTDSHDSCTACCSHMPLVQDAGMHAGIAWGLASCAQQAQPGVMLQAPGAGPSQCSAVVAWSPCACWT